MGYPNCKKLAEASERMDIISDFLEFARDRDIALAQRMAGASYGEDMLPIGESRLQYLLYDWVGIDPVELENERRAVIEEHRRKHDEEAPT